MDAEQIERIKHVLRKHIYYLRHQIACIKKYVPCDHKRLVSLESELDRTATDFTALSTLS